MAIQIVTDSACDVPPEFAEKLNIQVVPVYINIGDQSYLDGVELTRRDFFTNLPNYAKLPTTAAPASGSFSAVYQQLIAEGATEILSIHIAANLSNTYNAARLGAEDIEGAGVTLWDTKQITMGAGLQVIEAAEAAAAGATMPELLALLKERREKTHIYAVLDTLEFLRRSGRVNWAQFGFGTLLRIKPVLEVHEGEVFQKERVRTFKRALKRLIELVDAAHPVKRIAVLHANNLQTAEELQEQAAYLFPPDQEVVFMEITPAIGAHIGPGAVGFAFISK
ncbi:MAG: DegV family protein [Candidatus Promineifilaceae bacterium]|nr:DegV family protein [Candidatus Promineifilaceae bacterium]